ncbi:D-arabinono-1,4-lactone oxidase-domain-containing protein [Blastocladiella britannica]|nr:D-arabinono-1,4-lactone oxidase-domain-containing protein [Blastocladiella britannica]
MSAASTTTSRIALSSAGATDGVTNWSGIQVLAPASGVRSPATIEELQTLVRTASAIRPVGSRLTYEPVAAVSASSTTALLLDLSSLPSGLISTTESTATFWANTSLDDALTALHPYDRFFDCTPGVIGVQTLAGAMGTGTHGQCMKQHAYVGDALVGALVVRPRDGALVNVTDRHELDALRLHLGLVGVLVSVTVATRALDVHALDKWTVPLPEFLDTYLDMNADADQAKAWWFPETGLCHLWVSSTATAAEAAAYTARDPARTSTISAANLGLVSAEAPAVSAASPAAADPLADTIARLAESMERESMGTAKATRALDTISRFRGATAGTTGTTRVYGTIKSLWMKGIPVPQINCEIAIPVSQFQAAVRALDSWHASRVAASPTGASPLSYPFIFRCTAPSTALLSAYPTENACWIGFLVYLAQDGTCPAASFDMMHEIQAVLAEFGGVPHLGKHMALELFRGNFATAYPHAPEFLRIARRWDPRSKLGNELTDRVMEYLVPSASRQLPAQL